MFKSQDKLQKEPVFVRNPTLLQRNQSAIHVFIKRIEETETQMMRVLEKSIAALLVIGSITPAYAALETDMDYSALPQTEIALNEYTSSVACAPADPHYLPSFIRTPDGTIIGVGYVEIDAESEC